MVTAFMGYVLPWGQMSFWGATVITNLLSGVPCLVPWVCGGFFVSNPSLSRFFLFHFILPFFILGLISLSHPDNAFEVSVLVTPLHIVPEWYFLEFYAILKAVPSKNAGFMIMVQALFFAFIFGESKGHSRLGYSSSSNGILSIVFTL